MCLSLRNLKPNSTALKLLIAVFSLGGISSAADFTGTINLSWNSNPETNIAGYRIKYGTASGIYTQSQIVDWSTTATTISSLETGKTYFFAVQAYNITAQDGPISEEVSELVVAPTVPEISIEQSPSSVLTDGQTIGSFGTITPGSSGTPQTFLIRNSGTADLTNLAMTIDGADQSNFSVSTNLPIATLASVNGGFESAFASWTQTGSVRVLTNTSASEGSSFAEFNYANTESNGVLTQSFATTPGTTYTLAFDIGVLAYNNNPQSLQTTVTGSGSLLSQIVTVNGSGDGSTRWTPQSFTFMANSATTTLSFSDRSTTTAAIDLCLDHVRVTALSAGPASVTTLAPGATSAFTVTFRPSSVGAKTAAIHISSNDKDETPFDLTLAGNGLGSPGDTNQPEIEIRRANDEDLADEISAIRFSDMSVGSTSEPETLLIRNTGSANLANLSISIGGEHASEYFSDSLQKSALAPGESTAIRVYFQPTSGGLRSAVIHISSNDADENPFDIVLTGNGITSPEITVEHSATGELADGGSTVNFINSQPGSTGAPETFIITNAGSADLTGLSISFSGVNSSDFIEVSPGTSSLAPGDSMTFRVAFRPETVGIRTSTIHIESNDADENPFDIALTGNGITFPEIAIERSDETNLTDASSTVGFTGTNLGSSSSGQILTLRNLGTANLTGITVSLDGGHASDFILSGPAFSSLAPGATATFELFFKPTASGIRNASLHIASNDADESPFDIALTGNGIALPEIAVERSNGTNLTDAAGTVEFSGINLGSTSAGQTLTLRNSGTGTLTDLAVILVGDHASDFILEGPGIDSISPGASATFKLFFKPTASGIRNASLHIASNDTDESPFDIALTGNGIALPEIAVERSNGTSLTDATGIVEFGGINLGSISAGEILTLRNLGTAALTNLSAIIAGGQPSHFILEGPGVDSLAPGASATFRIFFKPTGSGSLNSSIRIASNDADENPFDIALSGNGIARPEIAVERSNGTNLADAAGTVEFSGINLGTTSTAETLTLRNLGTASLTGITPVLDGGHASDFILEGPGADSLAPGASTTFKILFKPTASGIRSASIHIASNDADENPFDIDLTGNGIARPRISVALADDIPFAGSPASVNFENVKIGANGLTRTFTISNPGTADLTGLQLTMDGSQAADFILESTDAVALSPGAVTTFKVTLKPTGSGNRTATLHIASNDPDFNPFNIALTGSGIAFPIVALENADGSPLESGAIAPPFESVTVGTTGKPWVLTIRNTGTATLSGLKVSTSDSAFIVGGPPVNSLEPGTAATFTVTFKPASGGTKTASLRIANSYQPGSPFEILLTAEAMTIPGIDLHNADGISLSGGLASENFGSLDLIAKPRTRTYTIINTGSANLADISLSREGPHAADFSVSNPGSRTVAPGATTTFNVTFRPAAIGTRSALLVIRSNAGATPITLALVGKGSSAPEIDIELAGKSLKTGDTFINFGSTQTGTRGDTRILTISNTGSAALDRILIVKNGVNSTDFTVTTLKTDSLASGTSTTFSISFKPTELGIRWGAIHVLSNDSNEKSFDIVITGKGTNKSTSKANPHKKGASGKTTHHLAAPDTVALSDVQQVKGIEVIDSRKYRTLTIAKVPGSTVLPRDIQVSRDLIDWSSGANHTTVLRDNATTLTVRDNTPVTPESKRYIRFKP